jgi:hypothetical protein
MLSPVLLALAAIPVGALRQGDPGTVRLNSAFDESFIHGRVRDFRIHPSGNAVLFRADARNPEVMELYSAPVDGSARPQPVVLLPADGTVTTSLSARTVSGSCIAPRRTRARSSSIPTA